jgi:hypothetical protein
MARFYTLELLVALLGAALVLRALSRDSALLAIAGAAVIAAGAAAHPSAISLLPPLVLAPFVARWLGVRIEGFPGRAGKALVVLLVLGAAGMLPWAADVWEGWKRAKGGGTPVHFALTTGFYVSPILAAGAAAGALIGWRRRSGFEVLASLVVAGVLGGWMVAATLARANAQYVIFLLPWICALAAAPLRSEHDLEPSAPDTKGIPRFVPGRMQASYLLLLALPMIADLGAYYTIRGGERPRWRDAYRFVWNRRGPEDLVLGMDAPVGEYYLAPERTEVRRPRTVGYLNNVHPEWWSIWQREERPAWLVVNQEQLEDWRPWRRERFERMLAEECRLRAVFPVHAQARDLDVRVYSRP